MTDQNDHWKKCENCGMEGESHFYFEGKILCYVCKNKELKRKYLGVS